MGEGEGSSAKIVNTVRERGRKRVEWIVERVPGHDPLVDLADDRIWQRWGTRCPRSLGFRVNRWEWGRGDSMAKPRMGLQALEIEIWKRGTERWKFAFEFRRFYLLRILLFFLVFTIFSIFSLFRSYSILKKFRRVRCTFIHVRREKKNWKFFGLSLKRKIFAYFTNLSIIHLAIFYIRIRKEKDISYRWKLIL